MNALTIVAAFVCCQAAEVRYLDGSNVVMQFESKDIELQTKYGKLKIPFSDVRRIDIGVSPSDAEWKEAVQTINALGGTVFKAREDAKLSLMAGGPNVYAVLRGFKTDDLEIRNRSTEILKHFEATLSAEILSRADKTVVYTSEFTVSGKIVGDELMAKSSNFGRQAVKFGSILSIVVEQPAASVTVDSKSINSWIDTGIQADSRMAIKVTASGQFDLWPQEPGRYMVGPQGYTSVGLNSSFMAGQLIGRIGERGTPFTVGQSLSMSSYESGKLYLQVVPAPWAGSDPVGSYAVKIKQVSR